MGQNNSDKIVEEVVKQLKKMRLEKGLSHSYVAKQAGFTRSAISHIENGNRKPSLTMAIRISHALGENLSDIMRTVENSIIGNGSFD